MTKLTEVFNDPSSRVYRVFVVVDINDSTAWKERESEASWITTYGWFFDLLKPVIEKYAGSVVKFLGDGALAVFGEDNATQAINASIAILETIKEENRKRLVSFTCSVAVASGEAREFAIAPGATDYLGLTVDRAFRLCGAANANALFVDAETIAAAAMNRVISQVGKALNRKTAEYQGTPELITLKGFASRVTYHEIWWDRDRYGVSSQFVTVAGKEGIPQPPKTKAPEPRVAESARPEWQFGQVVTWNEESGFGFVSSGGEDFYFHRSYVFSDHWTLERSAHVAFLPLPPLEVGKKRRASSLFIVGAHLEGRVTKLFDTGYGFADVRGRQSAVHNLFILVRSEAGLHIGDEIECNVGENKQGPIGTDVRKRGPVAETSESST